ncbi:hypothetical protein [Yoonia sp. 2307UL14-13]|uniref:hypothetical protein n=1 Tax=Yoonia sp. 2307UL14-13 TaxID=3126506 RepID=UPI0030A5DA80
MFRVLVIVLLMAGGSATAKGERFLSAAGDVFKAEQNRHGAVLTAVASDEDPIIVPLDAERLTQPGDIFYLGRSCDAFSERFGDGNWRWTDSGFFVFFEDTRFAFPGQEIIVGADRNCAL